MKTISKTRYALILGMLAALGPLCTDFYLPALPDVAAHLAASTSQSQLTLTATLVGLGAGQLVFGPLSDRYGRKPPLIASLLLFALMSLWCALANDITQLIVARLLQGVAGAGGAVLSRAIARDCYSGTALTSFFALLMAVNGIAPILAPVLGGLQLTVTGWHGLFISLAAAGLVMAAIAAAGLHESRPPAEHRRNAGGALTAFRAVLRDKTFMGLCFVQGFMLAGLFAYIGASSYVLQQVYQMTPVEYGLTFAANGAGLIFCSLLFARLARRRGEVRLLWPGVILAALFALILLGVSLSNGPLPLVLAALFAAIAINSGVCTLTGAVAMQSQGEYAGTASAIMGTLMFLMGGISAPLTGIGGASLISMAWVIFICYCLAGVSWIYAQRRLKASA